MISVLFICLGNICRSPSAEGVFTKLVEHRTLAAHYLVDSAGTGDWHIDQPPDRRAIAAAAKRDIDLRALRGRRLNVEDFARFDAIVVMDDKNFEDVMNICPSQALGKVSRLADYLPANYLPAGRADSDTGAGPVSLTQIADPYFGDDAGFETMLDHLEIACVGLLETLEGRRAATQF